MDLRGSAVDATEANLARGQATLQGGREPFRRARRAGTPLWPSAYFSQARTASALAVATTKNASASTGYPTAHTPPAAVAK